MKKLLLIGLLASLASAQTLPTATTTTTTTANSGTPYGYFASTGINYDYYAQLPSIQTGFGVRLGSCSTTATGAVQCPNTFLVTEIGSGVGANAATTGYATLSEYLEYHLARSGNWEFIGFGAIGVTSATTTSGGTVNSGTFAGGFAAAYDIGWVLSKKGFHLLAVGTFRMNAITATEVKPVYGFEIRKTFGN